LKFSSTPLFVALEVFKGRKKKKKKKEKEKKTKIFVFQLILDFITILKSLKKIFSKN
jgi:hypothetical protein